MFDLESVAESIDELSSAYTVVRTAKRTSTGGVLNAPVQTTLTIQATVHPAGGEELRKEDGFYASDGVIIHSRYQFQISSLDGSQEADRLSYNGRIYAATTCNSWKDQADFFKTVALLEPF